MSPSDLTADELEALSKTAATQMSPLLSVTVLRLISEVQRRRIHESTCPKCGASR